MRGMLWLLAGLCAGIAIGLLIGWVIAPVEYYDTLPSQLRSDYKDEYVLLTALSYRGDGRLALAQTRLELLEPDDPTAPLLALAEQLIAREAPIETVLVLADLARALQIETPTMRAYILERTP